MSSDRPGSPPNGFFSTDSSGLHRSESTASFLPEVCHTEDVRDPCRDPNCGAHSGLSRNPSALNLPALQNSAEHGDGHNDIDDGGTPLEHVAAECQMGEVASGSEFRQIDPPPAVIVQPDEELLGTEEPHQPAFDRKTETAVDESTSSAHSSQSGTAISINTPTQSPSPQQDRAQINWNFDDPSELQEHVSSGANDPFQQLRSEAPDRSSSFPEAPPISRTEPDEKGLLALMATEAAQAGEGERGPFDSPTTYLFQAEDAGTEGVFFDQVGRQETGPGLAMGGQALSEGARQDSGRFDEGVPLIQELDHGLVVKSKESLEFFGDDAENGVTDDFFSSAQNESSPPQVRRKNTEQVLASVLDQSGSGAATPVKTTASQVIPEVFETAPCDGPVFPPTQSDNGDDFFRQLGQQSSSPQEGDILQSGPTENVHPLAEADVAAKWEAALADDLDDDSLLPSDDEGILPSDDEGFLPSDDEEPQVAQLVQLPHQPSPVTGQEPNFQMTGVIPQIQPNANRYTPHSQPPQPWAPPQIPQQTSNVFAPQVDPYQAQHAQPGPGPQPGRYQQQQTPYAAFSAQQQMVPPIKKPESFVDKKEGYHSPYDLPMDIAPPLRRKASNLPPAPQGPTPYGNPPPPPVRSSSIGSTYSTGGAPLSPPSLVPPKHKPTQPKQAFFEDLPVAPSKPRSSSGRYTPNVGQGPTSAPGMGGTARPASTQSFYGSPQLQFAQPIYSQSPQQSPQITFAQPSVSGYSHAPQPMQRQGSQGLYAPPPASGPLALNHYSPAVPSGQAYAPPPTSAYVPPPGPELAGGVPEQAQPTPPVMQSKYSPRPSGPPQVRAPAGTYALPPASQVQTQPVPYASPPVQQVGQMSPPTMPPQHVQQAYHPPPFDHRRGSGEHVLHSSRPGTAGGPPPSMVPPNEEEEEQEVGGSSQSGPPSVPPSNDFDRRQSMPMPPPVAHKYAPPHSRSTSTPPPRMVGSPPMNMAQQQFSPKKRIPSRSSSPDPTAFQPPPRAQTSSPGLLHGRPKISAKPHDPYERPSSALARSTVPQQYPDPDPRRPSVQLNFLPPNDMTANDELKRWQGAPVISWGFGGTVVSMFPKRTQRYASDISQGPVIKCSPGEVKVRTLEEIFPLPEHALKYPGPMWTGTKSTTKAKKKEAITYMVSKIEAFEKSFMDIYDPLERRAVEETCMLWKVVRAMLDHDGTIEGSPEVEATVRKILTPEAATVAERQESTGFVSMAGITSMKPANAETVDANAVRTFRDKLLAGDREAAVWYAADNRLWAHALLISGTVNQDLWKRVVQEFVKMEVKTLGQGSESLAVLYETLAGNWDESVDELVPPSARMGMPMLTNVQDQQQSVEDKLGKWKETLALILSNRSQGDQASIVALGRLLANYGWISAAHICYIFARQPPLGGAGAIFGGADHPTTDFALLGVDHRGRGDYARDLDAIRLSEIYELAVSLSPHANTATPIFPHLQIWKLHHAYILAENGRKSDAQKYCDAVAAAVKAWNRPSAYFHQAFGTALEDLTKRLQEAPRDASSSGSKWIPKLTSDAVSNSMWGAFNKFVSGEESEKDQTLPEGEGPFGRITPDVSRVQSSVDLYSAYSGGGAPYGTPDGMTSSPPASRHSMPPRSAAGRYAPSTQPATARSSLDLPRSNPYESRGISSESYRPTQANGSAYDSSTLGSGNPYEAQAPSYGQSFDSPRSVTSPYAPRSSLESTPEMRTSQDIPSHGGYQPYGPQQTNNGYEPSEGDGYEPPSFQPYQPPPEDEEDNDEPKQKPKKKSFMDDDDDDAEFFKKAEAVKKAEEEKKRKEEEEEKQAEQGGKRGWFGGWFGSRSGTPDQQSGPIKAKLGEESSFVYDPDLKRWVNKKAGDTPAPAAKAAPPPKRTPTPSAPSTPAPPLVASIPPTSAPPPPTFTPAVTAAPHMSMSAPPPSLAGSLAPPMAPPARNLTPSPAPSMRSMRSVSGGSMTGSRPGTSSGGGDAMDELLGPPMPRKGTPAGRRAKKGGNRYVEVIPGQQ